MAFVLVAEYLNEITRWCKQMFQKTK